MSIRTILLTTAAVALLSLNGSGVAFAKNGVEDQMTDQADSHQDGSMPEVEDGPSDIADQPEVEDSPADVGSEPENEVDDSPGAVEDQPETEVEDTPDQAEDQPGTEVEDSPGGVENEPGNTEVEPSDDDAGAPATTAPSGTP
jgi:hypothetical protein